MRRACDWLVDRFVDRELDPPVRAALRLGAYQLAFLDTPPHAAVGETVDAVPKRVRGPRQRRAAAGGRRAARLARRRDPAQLPRLDRRAAASPTSGRTTALAALEAMNEPAEVTERADGYVQDRGLAAGGRGGRRGAGRAWWSTCARRPAARPPAWPVTGARRGRRSISGRLGPGWSPERQRASACGVGRGGRRRPPPAACGPASADRVLVDAPCSGLGALRRRPDARWRIDDDAVDRLAALQRELLDAAPPTSSRPAARSCYSVCTLTRAETIDVAERLRRRRTPASSRSSRRARPGRRWGSGPLLLPQAEGTDGMAALPRGETRLAVSGPTPVRGEGDHGVRRRGRRQPPRPGRRGASPSG